MKTPMTVSIGDNPVIQHPPPGLPPHPVVPAHPQIEYIPAQSLWTRSGFTATNCGAPEVINYYYINISIII